MHGALDQPVFPVAANVPGLAARPPVLLGRDLYGFIPAGCVNEFRSEPAVRPCHCVRSGMVAALAGPPSLHLPLGNRVRHALGRLRTYQRVLEQVMRRAPVLPARFGTRLPDRSATLHLLRQNENRLMQAIGLYGHLLQMEVQVTGPDPAVGSRALAAREHIRLELKSLSVAMREEPAGPARALLCMTVLIRPFDEQRLDAALARLDGQFGGWLRFHCIGPLPPCNFVRAGVVPAKDSPCGWSLSLNTSLPGADWTVAFGRVASGNLPA